MITFFSALSGVHIIVFAVLAALALFAGLHYAKTHNHQSKKICVIFVFATCVAAFDIAHDANKSMPVPYILSAVAYAAAFIALLAKRSNE